MNKFAQGHDKDRALRERMTRFGIFEKDLIERFIRSSGPGGQNVNKVETGVYLRHIPSGVEIKCTAERSQALNRYRARKILAMRMETLILGRESTERKRVEKIRRQKRKRSRRAKDKMLASKKMRSEKKRLRSRPDFSET